MKKLTFLKQIYLTTLTALLLSGASVFAQGGTSGPLNWNISGGVLTISGNGAMPDYAEDMGNYINIYDSPWYSFFFTSVVIETGVTSIGAAAFYDCSSLTSVAIPESVTSIGSRAFGDCSLASVTIPESVTSIGRSAFSGCSSLASVTISASVTSIESNTFFNCSSLASVTIPNGVTSIGSGAFSGCSSLASVTIPGSVTSIGSNAFWECFSLASVTIPASVTSIGEFAFYHCTRLTSIVNHNPVPVNITSDVFMDMNQSACTLIVPAGSVSAYQQAAVWKDFKIAVDDGYVPVTDITGVPATTTIGIPLTLSSTVAPSSATYQSIVWSVKDAGTTGAAITGGNVLNATAAGSVTVTASIMNGTAIGVDYTKDFTVTVNPAPVPVTDITGVRSDASAGMPITLSGTVAPSNATYKSIEWSVKTAGGTGATMDGDNLYATAAGTVTVTASIKNGTAIGVDYTKDFNIMINFTPVTNITGIPATLPPGVPLTLTGTVAPSNATYKSIEWSVKDAGTTGAAITGGNVLNTTAAGTVTVTAIIINGTAIGTNYVKDFDIMVDFTPVSNITGVPASVLLGMSLTLIGTVEPSNATYKSIAWSVKDAGTTGAKILGGSGFSPIATGTATVTATIINGTAIGVDYTKDFPVTVNPVPVTDITGVPATTTAGVPLTLSGTVAPNYATYQSIEWSVKDAGTTDAVINDGNVLYTTVPGMVTVTATIIEGKALGVNYTQDFPVDVMSAVGIEGVSVSAGIKIYPNPVKEELRIESVKSTIESVKILDITGKKLSTVNGRFSSNSINVSHLLSGVYFIKIETDNGAVIKKFIKE